VDLGANRGGLLGIIADPRGFDLFRKLKKNSFECKACNNKNKISQVHIPYAAKLLFQELASMNIAARLYTQRASER
jgi:DNA-directed RNA polymerase beta subunit